LLLTAVFSMRGRAADTPTAPIGVAKVDITPETPVRMYGYGSRKTESEGVAGRLSASALVIGGDTGQGPVVLLAVDNGSVPPNIRAEVLRRLNTKMPLKPEQLMLCNAHIHSGPDLEGMDGLAGQEREHMVQYAEFLTGRLEQVVTQALAARRPGRLAWATGAVGFAANRRVLQDGKWTKFGAVADGPVDHGLPVMRVTDADGKLMAVIVNYACHNTTLRPNFKQIHGDWGGCAQQYIQADSPGVVAVLTIGCGADADPSPHGTVELCEQHGREIADEVKKLLGGTWKPINPSVTPRTVALDIPFDPLPSAEELKTFADKTFSAAQTLKLLEGGGKPPVSKRYEITTWTFGDDLAMVFLSDEIVVDYALRLRREFDGNRLWINGYSNEVLYYVASKRLIGEGGYEVNNSISALVTYGRPERQQPTMEDRIVEGVRSIIPASFRTAPAAPNR
ncbi:MAG: neutral/alkaline non-lysosomal ceramidase N-terminal domain-containing protein, partial [Tepidisphaeraceae bacterium]